MIEAMVRLTKDLQPTQETVEGLAAGDVLVDQYQLVRLLGAGGMGEVWLARDRNLDRQVAVKVLPPILQDSERARVALRHEAERLIELAHPSVARAFHFGVHGDLPFLVMEFVPGPSLEAVIREDGALPAARVGEYLVALGGALDYAHSKKLIHRDVKAANVRLRDDGTPVLLDFGLAEDSRSRETLVPGRQGASGTLPYMSPEQLRAEEPRPSMDIYSLGVLAYQMMTGTLPFSGADSLQVREAILSAALDRPDAVPASVWEVLERAMAKDPEGRFASAGEFADAFQGAVPVEPGATEDLSAPSDRPGAPSGWLIMGGIVAAVVYARLAVPLVGLEVWLAILGQGLIAKGFPASPPEDLAWLTGFLLVRGLCLLVLGGGLGFLARIGSRWEPRAPTWIWWVTVAGTAGVDLYLLWHVLLSPQNPLVKVLIPRGGALLGIHQVTFLATLPFDALVVFAALAPASVGSSRLGTARVALVQFLLVLVSSVALWWLPGGVMIFEFVYDTGAELTGIRNPMVVLNFLGTATGSLAVGLTWLLGLLPATWVGARLAGRRRGVLASRQVAQILALGTVASFLALGLTVMLLSHTPWVRTAAAVGVILAALPGTWAHYRVARRGLGPEAP